MTSTSNNESQRRFEVQRIMNMGGSRRDMLKAAFAAGLIPVLTSAEAAFAQDATPVQGGSFFTLGHQDITTLSPENTGATVVWVALVQLFDALYTVDENYQLVPILAESYEASADGLTYTFKLKTGITFHNGQEFTSADVKYTYDWIMNPESGSTRQGNFELVAGVEAPDPTTVVVTLSAPDVTFLVNVAPTMIYPSVYHAEVGEEAFTAAPIGTGPFLLADPGDYSPASGVKLSRYDNYFRGPANFDTFELQIVPEAAGRMVALEGGQADNSIWTLTAEDNQTLEESGNFTVYKVAGLAVNHLPLNNKHPFLSDVNVRKAMMLGLDRAATLDEVYLGNGTLATANLSPAVEAFYNPNVTEYPYDPDGAAAMLDEAGWVAGSDGIREKDGVRAEFVCTIIQGDSQRRPIAEIAQALWAELGINMTLEEAIVGDILANLPTGNMDASLFNWTYGGGSGEPDARDTLGIGGVNNFSQYENAEVDELLKLGITQMNQEERVATYNRIQEVIADEVPFIFNLFPQNYTFYNSRVKGIPETLTSSDNLYQKVYLMWKEEA